MKKLILMLLLVVGGVITASANNVKRRLVVEFQDNIAGNWDQWKDQRYIYAWYYDGSDHDMILWNDNVQLTWLGDMSGTSKVFYYDFEADETVFSNQKINVILRSQTGDGNSLDKWNKVQISDIDFSNGDYFVQIYKISENDGLGSKGRSAVTYYVDEYDNGTKYAMTYSNGILTYDYNSTGKNVVIAPSYAIYTENSSEHLFWNLVYRPNQTDNDFAIDNFIVYSDNFRTVSGGKVWHFNLNMKCNLTFNLFTGEYTIVPYFERTLPSVTGGYATFGSDYDVTVPSGLTASYASAASNGKITWSAVNSIKAGKGALLYGTPGETYQFTPASSADDGTDLMVAIPSATQLAQSPESGFTAYVLAKVDDVLGFYKVNNNGSYVNAGTAYLKVPTQQAAREFFSFEEETTDIDAVKAVNMDGQAYNLNGQRVAQPAKGLYIVNGKKVIMK